jgi:alanine dehydrogenase
VVLIITVGVPKEVKNNENRVSMVPDGVFEVVKMGNRVIVEAGAGVGSGISDGDYIKAGAVVYSDKAALFNEADIIVKVKEPVSQEYEDFHDGQHDHDAAGVTDPYTDRAKQADNHQPSVWPNAL